MSHNLKALFVDPYHIGKGHGNCLLQHVLRELEKRGGKRIQIQYDPNATKFQSAAGAYQIGAQVSGSVPGQFLPLLQIDIQT